MTWISDEEPGEEGEEGEEEENGENGEREEGRFRTSDIFAFSTEPSDLIYIL